MHSAEPLGEGNLIMGSSGRKAEERRVRAGTRWLLGTGQGLLGLRPQLGRAREERPKQSTNHGG